VWLAVSQSTATKSRLRPRHGALSQVQDRLPGLVRWLALTEIRRCLGKRKANRAPGQAGHFLRARAGAHAASSLHGEVAAKQGSLPQGRAGVGVVGANEAKRPPSESWPTHIPPPTSGIPTNNPPPVASQPPPPRGRLAPSQSRADMALSGHSFPLPSGRVGVGVVSGAGPRCPALSSQFARGLLSATQLRLSTRHGPRMGPGQAPGLACLADPSEALRRLRTATRDPGSRPHGARPG